MEQELLVECADWIAEQMNDEGFMIDADLIQLVLEHERDSGIVIPKTPHPQAAEQLVQRLAAAGVQGAPDTIDARLVLMILQWEDDFLGFAGRPR